MDEERRRAPRIEVLGRLHGHVVSFDAPVVVKEISLVGLSFTAAIPFPAGAVHEFRLTLGDGSTVMLQGRVVRCQETAAVDGNRNYLMGVQFIDDDIPEDGPDIGGGVDRLK